MASYTALFANSFSSIVPFSYASKRSLIKSGFAPFSDQSSSFFQPAQSEGDTEIPHLISEAKALEERPNDATTERANSVFFITLPIYHYVLRTN